jgi:TolB-like protein/class 3 adenylate cyclase/thioredoxin-like negative regulator of GroEL
MQGANAGGNDFRTREATVQREDHHVNPGHSSRQLAVILHADVVSSTALVRRNEALAHERIQDAFRRLSTTITSCGGLTHELRGDALLAEFPRASDAVSAALAFQAANASHNATLDDDVRPEIRVGISLGEVIIADHTLTGPDVVLAQRLEQLAAPGGVCVSQAAYQSIPRRLPFEFEDLGDRTVKGFDEPVRAYAATLRPGAAIPVVENREPIEPGRRTAMRRARSVGLATAGLLAAVGLLAWLQPWSERQPASDATSAGVALPDQPSIAVLPFDNLGADPEQAYFSDGITEDLITDLSKHPGLLVISRNSSFQYRPGERDVRDIAQALGVRYVLSGSVRRAGKHIRINAELTDARSGQQYWADRYDGEYADVFALQDEITARIVEALALELAPAEKATADESRTANVEAYDAYLRGLEHYRGFSPDDFERAVRHLERAVELDPGFSRAYAALAAVYWEAFERDWHRGTGWPWVVGEKALEYLDRAGDQPTALGRQVRAQMMLRWRRFDEAIAEARRAIAESPNDPLGHLTLAEVLVYSGSPGEARKPLRKAMRLDPNFPGVYLVVLGLAELMQGNFTAAAESFSRATRRDPDDPTALMLLAAAQSGDGRLEEARSTLDAVDALHARKGLGRFSLDKLRNRWQFRAVQDRDRLMALLRGAGAREW